MDHTTVGKGARLRRAIVDRYNIIPADSEIGVDAGHRPPAATTSTPRASSWCRGAGAASSCSASRSSSEPVVAAARHRHPRPLLPAAAREPLARGGRGAGLGRPRPRLERAGHRRSATRPTRPPGASTTPTASSTSSTTSSDLLQRRAHAVRVAGRAQAPGVYASIVEADRASVGGPRRPRQRHRPGLQPHDHAAGHPRATRSPRCAGASSDFRARFGREPEGMWLPETAVDDETLEVLAEAGVRFTILAPHQARRVRPLDRRAPGRRSATRIDPSRALPAGAARAGSRWRCSSTTGPSRARSPSRTLLERGETLAARLRAALLGRARLAAARALRHRRRVLRPPQPLRRHGAGRRPAAARATTRTSTLTNYGAFLAAHPPTHEVEIRERTSWSCAHGVERWRADCGCRVRGDWHQRWRAPLREALDWLRDQVDRVLRGARRRPPARTRGRRATTTSSVVLDRSPAELDAFLAAQHQRAPLDAAARRGGAAAAGAAAQPPAHVHLVRLVLRRDLGDRAGADPALRGDGAAVPARPGRRRPRAGVRAAAAARPEQRRRATATAREVYRRLVRPAVVDLRRVVAHYAITGLFERPSRRGRTSTPTG